MKKENEFQPIVIKELYERFPITIVLKNDEQYCIQSFPGPDYSSCNSTIHSRNCKMQFKKGNRAGSKKTASWKENQYNLSCNCSGGTGADLVVFMDT